MTADQWKTGTEIVKSLAEVFALLAAGGYFSYRWFTGYFVTNLSLSVSCRRGSGDPDHEILAVSIALSKGDRGSIILHDASVRISWGRELEFAKVRRLIGVDRRSFGRQRPGDYRSRRDQEIVNRRRHEWKRIAWNRLSRTVPQLNLTPGEQTSFSCLVEVPAGMACLVEVAVLGQNPHWQRLGQWRSSIISLPGEETIGAAREVARKV